MRKGIIIIIGLLLLSQQITLAEEAVLDISPTNNRDDLLLYVEAMGAFTEKTRKAILSGVPTTFIFYIKMSRARNYWFDESIVNLKVTHVIRYDNLRKEFYIDRSWIPAGLSLPVLLKRPSN